MGRNHFSVSGKYRAKGRGGGGKREDLGMYFRSGWEANYARYLNFLRSIREIKSWKYEPVTFEFKDIKRGNKFYTPDFEILNNNNTIEYHEIKGYMDKGSATKLKRMSTKYPKVKLILIDSKSYQAIAKEVKRFINGWE